MHPPTATPLPPAAARFTVAAESLPAGDYVSPGLAIVRPDACFPHLAVGDPDANGWRYLRREIPHRWYVDARKPAMGFMNRDEAILLHNIARCFAGRPALEIGCWLGWSTCHLGLGGVSLDVLDPALADPLHREALDSMIACCGLEGAVRLHAGASPGEVERLARAGQGPWSLFVIDGDHEKPGPELDVAACLPHAAPDAAFVFHDLTSPDVGGALRLLEGAGFHVLVYQTQQIMGFAWRGDIVPVPHVSDPSVIWQLPHHLAGLPVSGVALPGYAVSSRQAAADGEREVIRLTAANRDLAERLRVAERDMQWRNLPARAARSLRRRLLG